MGAKQSTTETSPSFESLHEDWPWVWGIRDASFLDWKQGLSDDEIQAQALRQNDLPAPITDNVYLGNAVSVESVASLKARGITAVLNVAGPLALRRKTINAYKKHGIEYKRINAEDELDYPLLQNDWQEAFEFIKASTKDGKGKCVVHCMAGINRSGLIVSAYHMLTTRTTVLETVKHVRKQRGNVALCNEGFQQQLVAMARINNLLGPQPGTDESIIHQVPPLSENDWVFAATVKKRDNPLDRIAS
jgi:predicted protein tyrosine phosphatase